MTLIEPTRRIPPTRPPGRDAALGETVRPVVYYEGDRIYFRPLEMEDEPRLRRWINDPHNRLGLPLRQPFNAVVERQWIENAHKSDADYVFGIVVREGDRLIGVTGLHRIKPIERSAVFGINIGDRSFQNRGFGTEATRLVLKFGFEELNLHRISLSVFSNNLRAIRCYQKVGFVHEGCLREAFFRNGRYHDEYKFAMLRSDWEALDE